MISDNAIPHCGLELGCCSRQIPYDLLAHDRQIRADAIDECKQKLEECWLNGTVANRIVKELQDSLEQLKENKYEELFKRTV